jgi:2-succinyl-5-enolpyruvyl-6-hydroxy-3-cyclohexene-1-carboxylate synthase
MTASPASPASPANVQATFAATLVDEWLRCGVRHAVICPGSRSTPLALALSERPEIALQVHHDERSGAFLALGLGLATGRPAVVLTTSGTAAAELHAAVVEADLAGVPLLACTADRPPELRDVGAPQAIDQVHLYGRAVRWFGDPGVADVAAAARWRAFAGHAYGATLGARPGPVHLNLPFREPLVGAAGPLPPGRGDGRPWVATRAAAAPTLATRADVSVEPSGLESLAGLAGRRGVIVAGSAPVDGAAVHRLAEALGWPVLVEPRSQAWIPAATGIVHLDAILRSSRAADGLRPEAILRVGAPGASRVVSEWLAASGADEVVVGAPGWSDPAATAATVVDGPAAAVLAALGSAAPDPAPDAWLQRWRAASDAAATALASALARESTPNEPGVARDVVAALPDGARLVVASSMPIRDVERYAMPRHGVAVLANRGANGIDGTVSTAVGLAIGSDAPAALLIGDLAFLHDSNGLLGIADRDIDLVCVVVDNDGGGIFSFLPQARAVPAARFEALFGTPHGLDIVALAAAYGVDARALGPDEEVGAAVREAAAKAGVHVVVARTDRAANIGVHARVDGAVAAAVDAALS